MKVIKDYLVSYAVCAITEFCKEHGAGSIDPGTLAHITIALREQRSFEWTPLEKAFRRIMIVQPQEDNRVAIVFSYEHSVNQTLTQELYDRIKRHTRNRWEIE